MRIAGYTEAENDKIDRIDKIKNPVKKQSAITLFEEETGKSFPKIRIRHNPDAMSRISDEELGKGVHDWFPGGYKPWARKV
jgi:hypothetical protein